MALPGAQRPLQVIDDEEDYHFFYNPFKKAIVIQEIGFPTDPLQLFLTRPLYAPLLFPNSSSDARDHAANERTFLSYLRLSVYLAVVSVAIFINFHLKNRPTPIEERISHPLGAIFWILALACLAAGFANYIKTVAKYARRAALVQSGMKTQIVFGVVSTAIVAACGVFLAAEAQRASMLRASAVAQSSERNNAARTVQDQILVVLGNAVGQGLLAGGPEGVDISDPLRK